MSAITEIFRKYTGRNGTGTLPSPEFVAALFRRGQVEEADSWCQRILRAVPGHGETLLLQAEIILARDGEPAFRRALERIETQLAGNAAALCRIGALWAQIGDYGNAGLLYRRALEIDLNSIAGLHDIAETEEAAGRIDSARLLYDTILDAWPDGSRAYTRRAIMLMRQEWGAPLPTPDDKRQEAGLEKRIMMSELGEMGRFGHQLSQYLALRIVGRVHRLRVEVPEWAGRWLFDLGDPYPSGRLPLLESRPGVIEKALSEEPGWSLAGRDFSGYFYCPAHLYAPHRDFIRTLFRPSEHLRPRVEGAMARLKRHGRTLVALHIRRGDMAKKVNDARYWVAPEHWYLDWLVQIWHTLDAPVLYIASDDPGMVKRFEDFAPLTSADAGETIPGAEFFLDFHVLSQADMLAISPSNFSSTAACLNQRATLFMRPSPKRGRLAPYDPWETNTSNTRPGA